MKPKTLLCLALVLGPFSAKIADAQPGLIRVFSLEATIAQAQSVFRGVISNYTRTTGPQIGSGKYTLTVQVEEVIKGPPRKTVEFEAEAIDIETNELAEWTARHTSFLCFVNDRSGNGPAGTNDAPVLPPWNVIRNAGVDQFFWNVICLGDAVPAGRTVSKDPLTAGPVPAMDTTDLTKPEEILERAREFAKSGTATTKMHDLNLGYLLEVPVSPPLEAVARRLVRSQEWVQFRAEGAKALHYFKSAENIELLKPLLNDLGTNIWQINDEPWLRKRLYPARQAAYDVLQEWGVAVPKPVTEEVVPWEFDPAVRQKLEVRIPTKLWIDRTTNTLYAFVNWEKKDTTNVSAGSNMVIGVRLAWFVFAEGTPRPANASGLDLECSPAKIFGPMYFTQARDGLPVPGQKYNIEMDYTLFETDNPPPPYSQNLDMAAAWRPQEGKNYRVLLERTLKQTSE